MQILSEIVGAGLSRLRQRNPLAHVAAEHGVVLEHRDGVLVGRCPFERDPGSERSFTVWPGRGRYECCECRQGGDVIGFVMRMEGLGFVGAVQLLCARAGMAESEVLRWSEHDPLADTLSRPRPGARTPAWALTPLPFRLPAPPASLLPSARPAPALVSRAAR